MQAPTVTPTADVPKFVADALKLDEKKAPVRADGARNIRQARRRMAKATRKGKPNSARTPDIETLYGPLVKAGMARIERKKGQAPKVIFLDS